MTGNGTTTASACFFNREAGRLARAGIPIYLVKGNHDAVSVVTKTIRLPETVMEFSTRAATTHEIADLRVAIHGRSFPERAVSENWAVDFPAPHSGWFNIGLLHTSCEGNAQHATYAPCSIEDLRARGYDYWALGHIHQYQELHRDPWIVYPGNLQGRSIRETGEKGGVFVDVVDGRIAGVRRMIVDRARWVEASVDLTQAASATEAVAAIKSNLDRHLAKIHGRTAAIRLRLTGRTHLNGALRSNRAQWEADAQALIDHAHDDAWLEKLSLETNEPEQPKALPDLGGLDLGAMMAELAGDPGFRRMATEALAPIAAKLPGEAGDGEVPLARDIETLMREATAIVLTRAQDGKS